MSVKTPPLVHPGEWGARKPKAKPVFTRRPVRCIFHHTAGHHAEISSPADESREEAMAYARAIQNFHMDGNGWNDSGHNFLVCRNGLILVGRWQSYTAIAAGFMVVSAHCPGQNDQPGIEHEHLGERVMTPKQFEASAWLHAWIIDRCGMPFDRGRVVQPHSRFFATSCPGELARELPKLRLRVTEILAAQRG